MDEGRAGERGREQLLGSDRIIHVITPCEDLELGQSIFKRINYSPLKGRDTNSPLKMGMFDLRPQSLNLKLSVILAFVNNQQLKILSGRHTYFEKSRR